MSWDIGSMRPLDIKSVFRGREDGGAVVVEAGRRDYRGDIEGRAFPIMRLEWAGHLHAPAEPLHPSIVDAIARRAASLAEDAYAAGYARAQRDIREALGVKD